MALFAMTVNVEKVIVVNVSIIGIVFFFASSQTELTTKRQSLVTAITSELVSIIEFNDVVVFMAREHASQAEAMGGNLF
jgi:hypothetical protein